MFCLLLGMERCPTVVVEACRKRVLGSGHGGDDALEGCRGARTSLLPLSLPRTGVVFNWDSGCQQSQVPPGRREERENRRKEMKRKVMNVRGGLTDGIHAGNRIALAQIGLRFECAKRLWLHSSSTAMRICTLHSVRAKISPTLMQAHSATPSARLLEGGTLGASTGWLGAKSRAQKRQRQSEPTSGRIAD